jgi:mannitol PTS system EIIA component
MEDAHNLTDEQSVGRAIVSVERIQIGAVATDKQDAIRQAGQLLVDGGCVTAPYVEGMLARERTMSTWLGNGVAIPHGEYENRADIFATGISVLQLPAGVEWEPGELVHLVIGIAASGDEHVGVLSQLAGVVEDETVLGELFVTEDAQLIVERLSAAPDLAPEEESTAAS